MEEAVNCQKLQYAITSYLDTKLEPAEETIAVNAAEISSIDQNISLRAEAFQEFESRLNVCFTNVEISSQIEAILSQEEDSITLGVYEWTDITYCATDDHSIVDSMGYGTRHEMTFSTVDGEYTLLSDSFDERKITGICSQDILLEQETAATVFSAAEPEETAVYTTEIEPYAVSVPYDAGAAIAYANLWCGIKASDKDWNNGTSSSGQNEAYYNTAEYQTQSADCANFVSQCLVAGGLLTDSEWYPYSVAWVRVSALAEHFVNKRSYNSVLATSTNIYPGNPVYWINTSGSSSGHQMICTGYNSAGVAVLNAHNSDAFRIPYTNYTANHTLYTIQIVTSN